LDSVSCRCGDSKAEIPLVNNSSMPEADADAGATMVEFCIVAGLLVLFIFSIIDISRYVAIRALLTRGAESGVLLAQRMGDINVDLRGIDRSDPKYQAFLAARRKVIQTATALPLSSLVAPSGIPFATQLRSFSNVDPTADGPAPAVQLDGAIIRPGEEAQIATSGEVIKHPTLCPPNSGCPYGDLSTSDGWAHVLENNPFVVQLQVKFTPILPIFGNQIIVDADSVGMFNMPQDSIFPPSGALPPSITSTTTTTTTTSSSTSSSSTTTSSSTSTTLPCCGQRCTVIDCTCNANGGHSGSRYCTFTSGGMSDVSTICPSRCSGSMGGWAGTYSGGTNYMCQEQLGCPGFAGGGPGPGAGPICNSSC
jgi:hypothetical protein